MNWEAISASSEIIGALAILVTLIYLAIQLRQNTRSIQLSALQSTMSKWNEWSSVLATSPDLADIVAKGNADYAALSVPQSLRYGAWVQMFFDAVETYHDQISDVGVRGDEAVLRSIVARRMRTPGFVQWWQDNRADYDRAFQSWIAAAQEADA